MSWEWWTAPQFSALTLLLAALAVSGLTAIISAWAYSKVTDAILQGFRLLRRAETEGLTSVEPVQLAIRANRLYRKLDARTAREAKKLA